MCGHHGRNEVCEKSGKLPQEGLDQPIDVPHVGASVVQSKYVGYVYFLSRTHGDHLQDLLKTNHLSPSLCVCLCMCVRVLCVCVVDNDPATFPRKVLVSLLLFLLLVVLSYKASMWDMFIFSLESMEMDLQDVLKTKRISLPLSVCACVCVRVRVRVCVVCALFGKDPACLPRRSWSAY